MLTLACSIALPLHNLSSLLVILAISQYQQSLNISRVYTKPQQSLLSALSASLVYSLTSQQTPHLGIHYQPITPSIRCKFKPCQINISIEGLHLQHPSMGPLQSSRSSYCIDWTVEQLQVIFGPIIQALCRAMSRQR